MTKKELIEALSNIPDDTELYLYQDEYDEFYPVGTVSQAGYQRADFCNRCDLDQTDRIKGLLWIIE